MAKFTKEQRLEVKFIVANLSIKRIPDQEIIKEIYGKMNKTITRMELWNIRQRIKKESYHWYRQCEKVITNTSMSSRKGLAK